MEKNKFITPIGFFSHQFSEMGFDVQPTEEPKTEEEWKEGMKSILLDYVCKECKTGPHKQLIDGQCEWCAAGRYISEDIERPSDYIHIL